MKYFLSLVLVSLVALSASAQQKAPKAPGTAAAPASKAAAKMPGARETAQVPVSKADSAKLKAAFKELYPLIRPAQSIKERTEMTLHRMERQFKMQGIDSAKAWDSVMKAINPNQDEEILYNVFSENFTAEEIKSLATFFKTAAGKHYLEVEQRIASAKMQTDGYINRTIMMVTAPMRKPVEHKPGEMPGRPGMPMRPRPGQLPPGAPGQPSTAPTEPAPAPAPTPAPEPQH